VVVCAKKYILEKNNIMNPIILTTTEQIIEKTFLGLKKKEQGAVLIFFGLAVVVIGVCKLSA
jgi:hypothetical protein